MSMIKSHVQSHYHEGSPVGKRSLLKWVGFAEKVGFELSLERKSEGVMDDESGDDERDGLTSG